MPWPRRPGQVSGFEEAGLTYRVINAIPLRTVRQDISTFSIVSSWCQPRSYLRQAFDLLQYLPLTRACSSSHHSRCLASMALARRFSSRSCHRPHPDSARPTRSGHACSPPPPPFDSTHDARATPVSTGCDHLFSASPSAASPGLHGSAACVYSYPLAC